MALINLTNNGEPVCLKPEEIISAYVEDFGTKKKTRVRLSNGRKYFVDQTPHEIVDIANAALEGESNA